MDSIIIRAAVLDDLEVLRNFEQGVIKAERPLDVTLGPDPISYYDLKALILNDEAHLVVAELGGKVIASGYALIKTAKPYLIHDRYSYLGFMYTAPEYRGRGVNTKVLESLKEWSYAKGLKEIRLDVYKGNESAIRAYEKAGFKKHMVEMRLE
ncbi:GNAT family N-acetyltransferase [Maribacter sp. ANRC-HE7]|uniref:GNAT family N-acetyltransferase n=1 Tax=Maribacter aquimaris TaxID=2737171 RepID=A0ABR7V4Y4_9FLAO|nr:GNAT family N-acetyltransferase [Maribacter aquimaris]MBD0779850.1 GNAT family N-acetyltransferase [Maribacter aquimaris]